MAYGPGYGLVHSFVVVHVSKVVFGLVSGLWVGCLALYSIFMWTRGDTDGSSRITPFWCGRMKRRTSGRVYGVVKGPMHRLVIRIANGPVVTGSEVC